MRGGTNFKRKNDDQKHLSSRPGGPSNSETYLDHAKPSINVSNHSLSTFKSELGWDFVFDQTGDQINTTNIF